MTEPYKRVITGSTERTETKTFQLVVEWSTHVKSDKEKQSILDKHFAKLDHDDWDKAHEDQIALSETGGVQTVELVVIVTAVTRRSQSRYRNGVQVERYGMAKAVDYKEKK